MQVSLEHQNVLVNLKSTWTDLPFPELYTEMFSIEPAKSTTPNSENGGTGGRSSVAQVQEGRTTPQADR